MQKILTIVVPTYNAEEYLRDNLESLCVPDIMNDIEVLIVNDGSTDGSLDIALEYVQQYPDTYRVITKENGGHGSGINCGIKNAVGKYFKVVDADDWVNAAAFSELILVLKSSNADIVYSGFLWTYDYAGKEKSQFETKAEIKKPFPNVIYQKIYQFDDIADKLYVKMHNMTIKTAILKDNNIFIDEHCYYVDAEYITYPIPYVKTICFVDAFVYYYRVGRVGQSVGIDKMQRNEQNYDRVLTSLLEFYLEQEKMQVCSVEKRKYIAKIIARIIAGKIKIMLSFPVSRNKRKELLQFDKQLQEEYPEIYQSNINLAVSMLRKSRYLLYCLASTLVRMKYCRD